MSEEVPRFCKDCDYHTHQFGEDNACNHPRVVNVVTGKGESCSWARDSASGLCGHAAKYFKSEADQ